MSSTRVITRVVNEDIGGRATFIISIEPEAIEDCRQAALLDGWNG
jgi:hypothetical protein